MKTYDLALIDWIMAMTVRISVVFFLKTLLLESLNLGPSIALTVEDLKTMSCVVDRYDLLVVFLFSFSGCVHPSCVEVGSVLCSFVSS